MTAGLHRGIVQSSTGLNFENVDILGMSFGKKLDWWYATFSAQTTTAL